MYVKIPHTFDPNNPYELIDLPQDTSAWLRAVRKHLECSTIQVVSTIFRDIVLVIDDNGKMTDDWLLNLNEFASALYPADWDPIVGNAILARRTGADLVPITDDDLDAVADFYDRTVHF